MKASRFLLAVGLLGSLSGLEAASRRFSQVRGRSEDEGKPRAEAFMPGFYPKLPGGRKRYPISAENITNVNKLEIPDWLYLNYQDGGMKGFSVRVSSSVMLVPDNLESDKQTPVKDLEELISFDDLDRYEYIRWQSRPKSIMAENAASTGINIELFRRKRVNPEEGDSKPSSLKMAFGGRAYENLKRLKRLQCSVITYRALDDGIQRLFQMRLDGYCEDSISDDTFVINRKPKCRVFALETSENPSKTFEFCPEDNGAPVFCLKGELAFMLHISPDNGCSGTAMASRIYRFKDKLKEVIQQRGDELLFV